MYNLFELEASLNSTILYVGKHGTWKGSLSSGWVKIYKKYQILKDNKNS